MKPAAREWVEKAEGDYRTAPREAKVKRETNWDAVCFHAQQCIEKYLKSLLIETSTRFPKTHDLLALALLLKSALPQLAALEEDLDLLTRFAVAYRYPGESADKREAECAIRSMKKVRRILRKSSAGKTKSRK